MKAIDIMTQARERLGDTKKQRWSDPRLLSIVNQGQIDICIETGYLRKSTIISKTVGETIYQLPADCFEIKRVETYDELLIPLNARNDKDIPKANLSEYVAYKSNINVGKIEIIPAPTELEVEVQVLQGFKDANSYQVTPLYGVVTSTDAQEMDVEPLYGAVTGFIQDPFDGAVESDGRGEIQGLASSTANTSLPNGNYGVVVSMTISPSTDSYGCITSVKGHEVNGKYGIIANITSLKDTFKVYYVATPKKLVSNIETLILPELWEDLLMKYVVGTALQDDNDASNIQRGEYELNKYNDKLAILKDQSAEDFSSSASNKNETNFRRV